MRYAAVFILSIVVSQGLLAQPKISYTVSNGLQIQGVDQTNPVIYDNDMVVDTPEMWYLWLKANRKQVNLVGNISTKDGHPQGFPHDQTYKQFTDAYAAYISIGGQNVPAPVKGSSVVMTTGQTSWENSPGSDLIISEAKKASPSKPLVIFVGGQVTSIGNAVLKDKSIKDNILVLHVGGWGTGNYNIIDKWAGQVLLDNGVKYIAWDGDMNSWYNHAGSPGYSGSNPMPGVNISNMPSNAFSNMVRSNWYNQMFSSWGDVGDAPPVLYFFNHSLWQDVQRKDMQNQDVTVDNFAYLVIRRNDWNAYGPQLSAMLVDPNSYIPASQPNNQPPSVALTSPANNANFTVGTPITLTANASDTDGSVSRVEFFQGTTKIGEDLSSPYSLVWNPVTPGTYSITAKATDNVNATATSSAISITISGNAAPTVTLTGPANNANFLVGANVTISANASDADGTVSKVEFYDGAVKLGEDASSPYSFTWAAPAIGNHSLTAKAYDNLGAVTTSSAISISVTANNVVPNVALTSPGQNATFPSGSTITITANATDNDGSISKVEFFNGSTKIGEDLTVPYSFAWASVTTGTYTISAKATDNAGATSNSTGVTISVQPPNGAPTVSITSPANNATFNSGATITINAAAADADGSVSKVEFFNGATKLGEDTSSPYSFSWASVPAGNYQLTAKATDNTGATTSSATIAVIVTIPGNTAPTVSVTAPANNTTFTANSAITITANAADANGSVTKVEFFNGASKLGEDATAPYSFVWNNVAAGNYVLIAKATDNNNAVTTSAGVNIVVNAIPVAPTVAITAPANGSTVVVGSIITITATASTPTGSIVKTEFFDGTTKVGEDTSAPYTFSWTNAQKGNHTIVVKATSNQGLSGSSEIKIAVKTQVKNPPIANAGRDITQELPVKDLTLKGTGTDNDGQITAYEWVQVSGPSEISLTQDNTGDLYLANLVQGSYVFELTVTDNDTLTNKDQVTVTLFDGPIAQNIPRYFTPNNDGVNDTWIWSNIELYENSRLVIFNRFGQKIFETDSYQNNWNGMVDGKPLQEDAYYYSIRLRNADVNGAVRIVR